MSVVKLLRPSAYRVELTPEMLERAGRWLEEPLVVDEEAAEKCMRDIDAIVASAKRLVLAA